MKWTRISAVILCLLVLAAIAAKAPFPTDDWPTSTPAEQGLSPEPLDELVRDLHDGKRYPDVDSLLIVKNGYLVVEEYFGLWNAERLHTLQSVSKSITSALIGIAIERGEIRGVDEKILGFFPERTDIRNLDARKRAMTLEHLLTMRSGTDYNEEGPESPHFQLNSLRRGWDRFYLDRPMVTDPGTHFQYDSGGVILMSSLLKARTGLHADAYAERHLFAPLGITRTRWERNAEGHPHTGGGLDLRPRDMARFGLLYLRGGRWGERQVVPADWVETSLKPHVELSGPQAKATHAVAYGYLWWILHGDPAGPPDGCVYAAMGYMGQYIFLVPEYDLVVVATAGAYGVDQLGPIEFLYSHILKAVRK